MNAITGLLNAAAHGEPEVAAKLIPLVYDELRRLAAQRLAQESPGHTLDATGLVHEAYVRLVDVKQTSPWNGRGHFFAAAAEAMRRILVEDARRKNRVKHGGDRIRQELHAEIVAVPKASEDLLDLDDALTRLEKKEPIVAKLVQLRYFGGLTIREAAEILDISPRTADSYWSYARSFLFTEMCGNDV